MNVTLEFGGGAELLVNKVTTVRNVSFSQYLDFSERSTKLAFQTNLKPEMSGEYRSFYTGSGITFCKRGQSCF